MCKSVLTYLHFDWQIGTFFVFENYYSFKYRKYYGCNYG